MSDITEVNVKRVYFSVSNRRNNLMPEFELEDGTIMVPVGTFDRYIGHRIAYYEKSEAELICAEKPKRPWWKFWKPKTK